MIIDDRLEYRGNISENDPSDHLSLRPSALHIAAIYGLQYVAQELLDMGAPPECRDFYGRTPLYFAAMYGEPRIVEMLIARDDVNINTQTNLPWSWTTLIVAVVHHRLEIVRTLLQRGADVSLCSKDGTALALAIRNGDVASTKLLLEGGASPDVRDENNIPMIFMVFQGANFWSGTDGMSHSVPLMELLQQHGSDLKARDKSQRTLLHMAAEQGDFNAAQVLLAKGLDRKAVDLNGQTPLDKVLGCRPPTYIHKSAHYKFEAWRATMVELLSEKESVVDSTDESGDAPTASSQ